MNEESFERCEMNRKLWDAVSGNEEKLFTEPNLQKVVKEFLADKELPELLSVLRNIILECDNNYLALYKATIVMKYLCSRYPEKLSVILVQQSNVLKILQSCTYIDNYGKDRGINVRLNAEQLMDFIKAAEISEEAELLAAVERSQDFAANRLLQTLSTIAAVNSETVLEKLKFEISQYSKFLPGPMTPEKYAGLDKTPRIDSVIYGKIVERIIESFDENWPVINDSVEPSVERLMVVDGADFALFHENLIILTDFLKESTNGKVVKSIVLLLEKLTKSEALVSCIADICKLTKDTTMESAEAENKWQITLQILVSLPSRIANKLNGKVADSFFPENYAKIISLHIGRAISFVHSINRNFGIQPNTKMLSMLISKAVIAFGAHKFERLFDVMSDWCSENPDDIRECINVILSHTDQAAIHPIAVTFLRRAKSSSAVKNIFGHLLNDPNWKHVFTVKIPLTSYHADEQLLRNFIAYLSTSSIDKRALRDLFIRLLDIWGDRSAINHTSLEQHEYITKLIVMSVREVRQSLKPDEKDTARRLLFSGTSAHLESSQHELRAIGMITGEVVIENLVNSQDEPKLKYDYEGMPEATREMVERLRSLEIDKRTTETMSNVEEELKLGSLVFTDVGQRKLYELAVNCRVAADTTTSKALDTALVSEKKSSEAKVSVIEPHGKSNDEDKSDEADEDLDSDDDLVPYDMSNDTPASERLRPKYLRDFKENLLNAQSSADPNIFEESMRIGEELVLSQLPNDDATFGVELLEILVSLRQISCVANFELLKFKCCVAVATVFPAEAAKYLCNEFHKKLGQYSIEDRLFILDVLAEASRKLSKIEIKPEAEVPQPQRKRPQQVGKPVSLAIDMSNVKKYETLYDDDFEVISSERTKSTTDWEEIVGRRIRSNTRIFAHASKRPVTTVNKFNDVASSFFYPLLYGFRRKETCMYNTPATFDDQENILLVRYLKTLSTIMIAAENCVIVPKIAKEILDLAWTLRYHSQAKVRLCVMENTASVAITLPNEALTAELMELIFEIRAWLDDVSSDGITGDPDSSCRALGKNVVALIDSVFHSTLKEQ